MADEMLEGSVLARLGTRAMVMLRVQPADAPQAIDRLGLPGPGRHVRQTQWLCLWLGPEQWLLASDDVSAANLIEHCGSGLAGMLHAVLDHSAGLCCLRLVHPAARTLLSAGCGLDLRVREFSNGHCARTAVAGIPVLIAAIDDGAFDLYFARSYENYLRVWFARALEDPLCHITAGVEI
ncbi:MAG: hypothetical protein JJU27_04900 [Gammaproteobacteria bacterium]|nr:hypothetical protein [Gammaproteobacteria bacterium]